MCPMSLFELRESKGLVSLYELFEGKPLNLLKDKIITKSSERHPSFLMVLTARGSLYQREDGIYVVPINCLRD